MKAGLAKDLERLLIYELATKGLRQHEIAKETGLSIATIKRDQSILKARFMADRQADFNLEFNNSMVRMEAVIKEQFRDLMEPDRTQQEKQVIFATILDYLKEKHKLCGFYQSGDRGLMGESTEFNFINVTVNGQTKALNSAPAEVKGEIEQAETTEVEDE